MKPAGVLSHCRLIFPSPSRRTLKQEDIYEPLALPYYQSAARPIIINDRQKSQQSGPLNLISMKRGGEVWGFFLFLFVGEGFATAEAAPASPPPFSPPPSVLPDSHQNSSKCHPNYRGRHVEISKNAAKYQAPKVPLIM